MKFDEIYFKTQNYTNYLEREIRYKKMAQELSSFLVSISRLSSHSKLLDYGCATGFLVKGFRTLGYKCDGYDISDWAKSKALSDGIEFVEFKPTDLDIMFSLDVFEHMLDADISLVLSTFRPQMLIVRIPCSTDGGQTFKLEVSRKDPTHINCKTKHQWVSFFERNGYFFECKLDLYTIYDTEGVMCCIFQLRKD